MSKRKAVHFDESSNDLGEGSKSQKINNAIDSDEEEPEDESLKYALKDEDIEGQEDGVADAEGDIQFTGFNMKEELEEGHFDKDGMYHWNKEKEIKDSWLDNIDWVKIKKNEDGKVFKEDSSSDDEPMENKVNVIDCYKKILTYLQPRESVAKALKRFGGSRNLSASERLKLKKSGELDKVLSELKSNSDQLTDITELANKILTETGNMDVYQETFEIIQSKIEESNRTHAKEAVLDMYADDFDVKEKERLDDGADKKQKESQQTDVDKPSTNPIGEVMWEVKRTEDSESIEGPFTSAQMNNWAQSNHFGEKALVRKCGSNDFYSFSRIDFELYV